MVELGKNITEDSRWLIEFVRRAGAGVIASNSGTGYPESAYVHLAANDMGRIIFGTNALSRKFTNITSDPRISLVILNGAAEEVQIEGEAVVLDETQVAAAAEVLGAQHPDSAETSDPENMRLLEVTVRWASHTDAREVPPAQRELEL